MNASEDYDKNEKKSRDIDQINDGLNHNLQKVVKGTVIVFIGTIVGILLAFVGRVLFARFFTPFEYGILSLGVALLSVFALVGTLGLREGTARQIAYFLGKKQTKKVQLTILWSLTFSVITGIIISLTVFLFSDVIAIRIFNMSDLSIPLKILSTSIPFYILILMLNSVFRGFKRVKERVYFLDLIRNLLFPLLLVPVILLGISFEWGITAYTLSIICTSIAFFIYFTKKMPINLRLPKKRKDMSIGKELLIFSLPLLLVTILYQVMGWTDTLMLGYFKTPDIVGLYNAANPLGRFISTALGAMLFIYTPVISNLYAKSKDIEMKRSYAILTKWLCAATLPLALIFALFPRITLNFFFGPEYISAGIVLQILAIGFFINNLMGPNGATLIAMGKTKFLMGATFAAACINVGLNVLLIPKYGVTGAAIATVTALVSINIIRSIKLYSLSKIHSLEKNILKPILLSGILAFAIYFITKNFITIVFWMLPILFLLFILLYCISLVLTKSFDKEDVDMLIKIEKKTGLNLTKVKQFIERLL